MRALVTGVAGFIGSSIAERWLEEPNNSLVGIDSLTDYYSVDLKMANVNRLSASERFTFIDSDLRSATADLLDGIDVVFHHAAQPGVRASWGSTFAAYTDFNVNATQHLLEVAKHSTIKRFVYASSSSVYGDAEMFPTAETTTPKPFSPYGVTKLAAEHLCSLYARNFGVPTVSLRYFTVYGPRQRPDMAFTRFLIAATTDTPIRIYGDGHQVRDFTFIDDVVRANLLAAEQGPAPGSVFNVAGGSNVSVREVIDTIAQISGRYPTVEYLEPVAGDVRKTRGATDLIAAELGWAPRVTLREGLERQHAWVLDTNSEAPNTTKDKNS